MKNKRIDIRTTEEVIEALEYLSNTRKISKASIIEKMILEEYELDLLENDQQAKKTIKKVYEIMKGEVEMEKLVNELKNTLEEIDKNNRLHENGIEIVYQGDGEYILLGKTSELTDYRYNKICNEMKPAEKIAKKILEMNPEFDLESIWG